MDISDAQCPASNGSTPSQAPCPRQRRRGAGERSDVRIMGRDNAKNLKVDMAASIAESRARQGLPPKVIDGATLRRVAALLTSGAPLDGDPARVEAIQATDRRG
ncbi:MAG: hypothetical protein ACYCSX_05765 [Acidimicrobiales bacterium]